MVPTDLCVYCENSWLSVQMFMNRICCCCFSFDSLFSPMEFSIGHICVYDQEWMSTFYSMECLCADDEIGQFILGFIHADEYYWNISLNNNYRAYFSAFFPSIQNNYERECTTNASVHQQSRRVHLCILQAGNSTFNVWWILNEKHSRILLNAFDNQLCAFHISNQTKNALLMTFISVCL